MNYEKTTLANGVRVLITPIPSIPSATLTIWVKTGSRLETAKTSGLSHFLEHMVFKGSKSRPTAREIAEEIDAIGGEFNAGTSKDWTNFYIKTRAERLDKAFDVLSDAVLHPLLSSEEIEREKGVIAEEIKMYEDTPMMKIGDVFEELIFAGNPLGKDTAGDEKTVRLMQRNDFVRYRKAHYYPANILVTVAGNVKKSQVLALAGQYFGEIKNKGEKDDFSLFKSVQNRPQIKLHSKKKEQAHFILGFLGNGRNYPQRYAEALLATILGGGMSSRLFSEIRERRGLAYAVKSSTERYAETGYLATQAGVDIKRVDEAIEVTLDQHYGLVSGKYPISQKELEKAKEYIKGNMALALEDTKDVNAFFAEQELFLDSVLTPEEAFKKIDKIEIKDVLEEAKKLFKPERLNLAVIGPYKKADRFARLLK